MSLTEILDTLLLKPLQLIFEVIYAIADRVICNPGLSIVVLSLVMNFLVLPLYKRADAMQEEERRMEMLLQKGVAHIKKTFSGDEQMLMLRTYYRQNNYKPTYVLRGATSLFLEIPFFIAAYRFLSGLTLLNGVSFGPIADLGLPDGMLQIAGLSINVLPFLMTGVNLVSCVIFTKDSPLKMKLQLYGMAAFFLVFLYDSPAGLVFYWTLNNIFSLVKTIFYKLKNPGKVLCLLFSVAGACLLMYGVFSGSIWTALFVVLGMAMQIPIGCILLKKYLPFWQNRNSKQQMANKMVFFSGGVLLSVLTGILIPSAVIKSSPQEFLSNIFFYHPVWFIVSSFCMALGLFVIWMGVFYWLASPSAKAVFDKVMWIGAGIAVVDYMFFNRNFGNLSSRLKYEEDLEYTFSDQLWNVVILFAAALALYMVYRYFRKIVSEVLIVGVAALGIMSIVNISYINSSVKIAKEQMEADMEMPSFTLSKTGKNVVIIMLDRAMGEEVPYLFDEKPELKEQFSGFTYYSNTISFGGYTNVGAPALLGGYEYTPIEMNKRDKELLVAKHNEALKVMPVLFDQNGYEVTVCNPVYANYQWTPDLSIYDDYPDIRRYNTGDKLIGGQAAQANIVYNKRNFFCYSMVKVMPFFAQKTIYNKGNYNQTDSGEEEISFLGQAQLGPASSEGMNKDFMAPYSVLENLSSISNITSEDMDTFLFMVNDTTHEPMMLQTPDYVPSMKVDNTAYEESLGERVLNGRTLKLENWSQKIHYHANMAAMIQLGKWFDYMRKEGVYDNTRIILVSDHGRDLGAIEELEWDDEICLSFFYPLLMVKDFGSKEFTVSDEFMTNGDVPTLATEGIIDEPINPFTGNKINSDEKTAHDQYIILIIDSENWKTDVNNGYTFLPADWMSVHDNIWDKSNWNVTATDAVLKTYE